MEAENEELKRRLKAVDRGLDEEDAAEFHAAEKDERTAAEAKFTDTLGENLGRFAAGMKLASSN